MPKLGIRGMSPGNGHPNSWSATMSPEVDEGSAAD